MTPRVEILTQAQAIAATRKGKAGERVRWATAQILAMKQDQWLAVTPDTGESLASLREAFKIAALALGLVMRLRGTAGKLYVGWTGKTMPPPPEPVVVVQGSLLEVVVAEALVEGEPIPCLWEERPHPHTEPDGRCLPLKLGELANA